MKIFKKIILFLGIIFFILLIFSFTTFFIIKNLKIKEIIENEIEKNLGVGVSIEKIDFSPLLARVGAGGLTIHNPSGFKESELAYIDSIYFVFDPVEVLIQKKPNFYLFTLDLRRLNIIKNKEGRVNIKEIIPIKEQGASGDKETSFSFNVVVLSIGEVRYIDYTGSSRKEQKYVIGIKNAAFIGLKDSRQVTNMVIYKAIQNTEIGKMINLTIVPFVSQFGDTVNAAWGTAKTGAKGIWDITTYPFKLIFNKD